MNAHRLGSDLNSFSVAERQVARRKERFHARLDLPDVLEHCTRMASRKQITVSSVGSIGKDLSPSFDSQAPCSRHYVPARKGENAHTWKSLFHERGIGARQSIVALDRMVQSTMKLDMRPKFSRSVNPGCAPAFTPELPQSRRQVRMECSLPAWPPHAILAEVTQRRKRRVFSTGSPSPRSQLMSIIGWFGSVEQCLERTE